MSPWTGEGWQWVKLTGRGNWPASPMSLQVLHGMYNSRYVGCESLDHSDGCWTLDERRSGQVRSGTSVWPFGEMLDYACVSEPLGLSATSVLDTVQRQRDLLD
jgi:hypothetical protein